MPCLGTAARFEPAKLSKPTAASAGKTPAKISSSLARNERAAFYSA